MNDKDFTDKIEYTKELSHTGRIRHRAKLTFYAECYQDPRDDGRFEDLIKDKLATMIHREIYENRRDALGRAIDELLSCVEPFFLPSQKLIDARDKVLEAAQYKPGNRLVVQKKPEQKKPEKWSNRALNDFIWDNKY